MTDEIQGWIRVLLVIAATILAYISVGTLIFGTDKYRLDSQCMATGFWGTLEESLLGRRFWRAQASLIDKEILFWETLPKRFAQQNEKARKAKQRVDESFEQLYAKNPELRPSPADQQAQLLRTRADEIEEAESREALERQRLAQLQQLRNCRVIASGK